MAKFEKGAANPNHRSHFHPASAEGALDGPASTPEEIATAEKEREQLWIFTFSRQAACSSTTSSFWEAAASSRARAWTRAEQEAVRLQHEWISRSRRSATAGRSTTLSTPRASPAIA